MSVKIQVTATFDRVQAYLKGAPQREAEVQRLWKEHGSQETPNFMRGRCLLKRVLCGQHNHQSNPKGHHGFSPASYAGHVDQVTKPHTIYPSQTKTQFSPDQPKTAQFSPFLPTRKTRCKPRNKNSA